MIRIRLKNESSKDAFMKALRVYRILENVTKNILKRTNHLKGVMRVVIHKPFLYIYFSFHTKLVLSRFVHL